MKSFKESCLRWFEQTLAFAVLVILVMPLALLWFVIYYGFGNPVLVVDPAGSDHASLRVYRFRTPDNAFGRLMRTLCIDRYPMFWGVVCGRLHLWDLHR
jgi:lipopolysaccharide/colanic/teichoic acid biosynthesis glycosyltransferase